MKKARLVCIACMATLVSLARALQAGTSLPGSFKPPPIVMRESPDFVAVCVAEDEPATSELGDGARSAAQRFRLLGLVVGRPGGRSAGTMRYRVSGNGLERAVRRGERVIWVARCADSTWIGLQAVEDTPENRLQVYSRPTIRSQRSDGVPVWFHAEWPPMPRAFSPGRPIPIRVEMQNSSDSSTTLWSSFSAVQFEVLAEDGEPVTCQRGRKPHPGGLSIVEPRRSIVDSADLVDVCDWLSSTEQRSYTLLWRAVVRAGDRETEPLEVISNPIRLTVLEPSSLAWGEDRDGARCGLAAERYNLTVGDRAMFHFGLRPDTARVAPDLHFYGPSSRDEIHLTFKNVETETTYRRGVDSFGHGPPYTPKRGDFFRLRDHPVLLWTIPVRLLHPCGEQIPAGTYLVTATYESRHAERTSCPPDGGPWKVHRGPLVSGAITVRVQHADPESVEIYTHSGIELEDQQGLWAWRSSQENPRVLRAMKRPGGAFHARTVTSVAIGAGEFRRVGSGGYGGLWVYDRFVSSTWTSGFPVGLGPDASRALTAGEPVRVRVEVTIVESPDADPHAWRGDSRVVWQGRMEAARP